MNLTIWNFVRLMGALKGCWVLTVIRLSIGSRLELGISLARYASGLTVLLLIGPKSTEKRITIRKGKTI